MRDLRKSPPSRSRRTNPELDPADWHAACVIEAGDVRSDRAAYTNYEGGGPMFGLGIIGTILLILLILWLLGVL